MEIGSKHLTDAYLEDIHFSEKEKSQPVYLKDNMDYWISNLVREQSDIRTYRNYYAGVREAKEFAYITENYGIGTPTELRFTNIIKPRIDALLGHLLTDKFMPMVHCRDDKTISKIEEQKKKGLLTGITTALDKFIKFNVKVHDFLTEEEAKLFQNKDIGVSELSNDIARLKNKYGTNFLSDYEIAAYDIVNYFHKDNHFDVLQKLKQIALDVLITGRGFYRIYVEVVGQDPIFDVIKPENLFYNKNTNSQYLDTVDAIVHREYMTRKEVLARYGRYMDKTQKEYIYGSNARIRTARSLVSGRDLETYYQEENPMMGQKSYSSADVVEVYHVEWIALNRVNLNDKILKDYETVEKNAESKVQKIAWRMDRYEGIRIAGGVYLNAGKSKHITRSQVNPLACGFTYDGIVYNDRAGKPFSLVGALKEVQDMYDLTIFYRDTLIAGSGVKGDRINLAAIPKQLGTKFMPRLFKFLAIKRNGAELIDPTSKGAHLFQHYGSYDNSVNGQSLQALEFVLEKLEHKADIIAGTTPQMLGAIEQREAVTNVKTGIYQSLLMNEDLFSLIRTNHIRVVNRFVQEAQLAYSKGKKGSYIVGSESYVFQIKPAHFSFTDYAITINYSSEDVNTLQSLKQWAGELIKGGLIDPQTMIHILLSNSATEIKQIIDKSIAIKKQENNQLQQAAQQIEEMEKQIKQLNETLQQTENQLKSNEFKSTQLREKELQLKEHTDTLKLEIEKDKVDNAKNYNDKLIALKEQLAQLEREQLYMGVGAEKKINKESVGG